MKTLNRSFGFIIVVILFFAAAVQNTTADEDKEAIKQLKATAKSPSVQEALDEPDGVGYILDEDDWKIYAKASATYEFDDEEDQNDAVSEATERAKKKIAQFVAEEIASETDFKKSQDKNISKSKTQASDSATKNVTKSTATENLIQIRNSAHFIGSGIMTLEDDKVWRGNDGRATVTVGVSKKTLAAANLLRRATAEALKDSPVSDSVKEGESSKSPPSRIRRRTKSDF